MGLLFAYGWWTNGSVWECSDIGKTEVEAIVDTNECFENLEAKREIIFDVYTTSWAEIAEKEDDEVQRSIQKAKEEKGRKLFVGNIINESDNPAKCTTGLLVAIFSKYGSIEVVRFHLSSKYAFIVFHNKEDASKALYDFKNYKVRCSWVNTITKQLKKNEEQASLLPFVPKPSFYCRWPKDKRPRPSTDKQQPKKKETKTGIMYFGLQLTNL